MSLAMTKHSYTEGSDYDDVSCGDSALPQTSPCSTATTISQKRAERVTHRRVVFQERNNHHRMTHDFSAKEERTLENNVKKTPQSPGNFYTSLGGKTDDDETTNSLHDYNHVAKEEEKEREQQAPSNQYPNILCPSSLALRDIITEVESTFEDTVRSFKQVLYAFVITPDDIDGMADTIHEAKDEVLEI